MPSIPINLVDVKTGTRLTTLAGECVEVVENPQDGTWLLCRVVPPNTPPGTPLDGPIEPVFAQDIDGLAT